MTGMTTDVTSAGTDGTGSDIGSGGVTASPRVLLYSDDRTVREQVRLAVGPRLHAGSPDIVVLDDRWSIVTDIEWLEIATPAAVVDRADNEKWDLLVLDGEADQTGGMGLCRQLKNEIYECPPVLILTGRPADTSASSRGAPQHPTRRG